MVMRSHWLHFALFSIAGLLIVESSISPESGAKTPFLTVVRQDWNLVSRYVHSHGVVFSPKEKVILGTKVETTQKTKALEKFSPSDNTVVYSKSAFDTKVIGEKSILEKIYTPEFTRQMQERYRTSVAPQEKIANDPFGHVSTWEQQAYDDQRRDMAQWTARQALNDRVTSLFSNADPNSSAMQIMHAVKSLNGEDDVGKKPATDGSTVSGAVKTADAKAAPVATSQAVAADIPTRVKAKLNVLKGQGQVDFTNPIVMTTLNVDVNSAIHNSTSQTLTAADDPVRLDMKKEFKSIDLSSGLQYGFEKQIASFNVTKKLTDHISCVASSDQYTGEQRNADGSKGQQVLRMNYSLSF